MKRRTPHRGTSAGGQPKAFVEPMRTCVVCREQLASSHALRVALVDGHVALGPSQGGRGVYVCLKRECLEALDAKQVSRALRQPVRGLEPDRLLADAHLLAAQRVLQTIGLARRMAAADFGVEAISARLSGEAGGGESPVLIVAPDLAERSIADLERAAARHELRCHHFKSGSELGQATGMGWLGAVLIGAGHLAHDAAYWLSVWYVTAPSMKQEAMSGPKAVATWEKASHVNEVA